MSKHFVLMGAMLGALGVMLGAFGAHGLRELVTPDRLAVYRTGVDYQMWHAIAIVLVGLLKPSLKSRWTGVAGWLMFVGVLIFSGSLYILVIAKVPALGMITPIGGLLMILGWLSLAVAAMRYRSS